LHLFGSEDYFKKDDKYTLDRCLERRTAWSAPTSRVGKSHAQRVDLFWGGKQNEVEVRKADDLFAAYKARDKEFPKGGRHTSATFEVKYADVKATRSFTIRVPRGTKFTRDEDGLLLYTWMKERKFIVESMEDDEIHPDPVLATASV
jgi:hypothetical protein